MMIKKLLLSTIIVLVLAACHKEETEIPFDLDCNHTQELREDYLKDAATIQKNYIYKKELSDTANIYLDNYEVERRLCELIAIKNWSDPVSDTLFNILNLRANYATAYFNCIVMYLPNDALPNLSISSNQTGSAEIDSLIKQYNLSIDYFDSKEDEITLYLCADTFTNTRALNLLFEEIAIITRSVPLYSSDEVKDIDILLMEGDYLDYVFTKRWRDSENILVNRKWRIRVYDDYRIGLRETTGNALP